MKVIAVCFFAFLLGTTHGLYHRYVYEFGQDYGDTIETIEGSVALFHKITDKQISVPENTRITYVKVVVDALSAPKVDFNADENKVVIEYSWTQLALSNYSILVKGIKVYE